MGHGHFDNDVYNSSASLRRSTGRSDFEYTETATKIHASLDPKRILSKPFALLESRDSVDHPESVPVVITFDVTGSNIRNAQVAQEKLPQLMDKLKAFLPDVQVAVWANDDVNYVGPNAVQLGEFESDNRIDESIRNIWLTGQGGGNDGESYDLLLYAAARKVITDSFEVRKKKGYLILYADEPFFSKVRSRDVIAIFNDGAEGDVPIQDIIKEASEKWNIFVLWPQTGYAHARKQYEELFGVDRVETLQSPNLLCDKVASIVAAEELKLQTTGLQALSASSSDYSTRVE